MTIASADLRDMAFEVVERGYDPREVDEYADRAADALEALEGRIAELESSAADERAVARAVESLGEETKRIVTEATEAARGIKERAEREADELRGKAEAGAKALLTKGRQEHERQQKETEALLERREYARSEVEAIVRSLTAVVEVCWEPEADGTVEQDGRATPGNNGQRASVVQAGARL